MPASLVVNNIYKQIPVSVFPKMIQGPDIAGPILPNFPKWPKNLRNFTILNSNTSTANIAECAHIAENAQYRRFFFEISVTNYFVGVKNDVIFKIESPKFTLFSFCYIAFGGGHWVYPYPNTSARLKIVRIRVQRTDKGTRLGV
jgi:hypothetical protein